MGADTDPVRGAEPLAGDTAQGGPAARLPWRKLVLLAGMAGVLLAVVYLSPMRGYLGRLRVSEQVRGLGILGPLAFMLGIAALVAVGFPRLLLCAIAGMALGFWSGLLWAQLGTLLGNYATFLVARFGARHWAQRYLWRHARLQGWVRREGIAGVILARQLPMPGLLINLGLGLLPIRQRHFLLGTALGQLPEAVPCTLIGAGALQASAARSAGLVGLGAAAAVLVWVGLRRFLCPESTDEKTQGGL